MRFAPLELNHYCWDKTYLYLIFCYKEVFFHVEALCKKAKSFDSFVNYMAMECHL